MVRVANLKLILLFTWKPDGVVVVKRRRKQNDQLEVRREQVNSEHAEPKSILSYNIIKAKGG